MSLPTERTEHFVLKEDGKIYWIEKMPATNVLYNQGMNMPGSYNEALQSAISNAVEVSNQEEVEKEICDRVRVMLKNYPYPLQCSVEKKEIHDFEKDCDTNSFYNTKLVALVTFSQPEREETQEELNRLREWIASDSVYQALRLVFKSPSHLDAEDDHYIDLYNLSTELRKTRKTP